MSKYFLLIFALVVAVVPVHAQDEMPPTLSFEDFSPSDRVSLVENLPVFSPGAEEGTLYFRKDGDWITAEFPEGFRFDVLQPMIYHYLQPDGSYLLFRASIFRGRLTWQQMPVGFLWRFDPATQTIDRPESFCGHLKPIYGDEGAWVIDERQGTDEIYLCNTETEQEIRIPSDSIENQCEYDFINSVSPPLASPDGRYVALSECWHESDSSAYVYDTQNDEFKFLGTTPYISELLAINWINNDELIYAQAALDSDGYGENGNVIYVVDVNQPAEELLPIATNLVTGATLELHNRNHVVSAYLNPDNSYFYERYFVESGEKQTIYTGECDPDDCQILFFKSNYDFLTGTRPELIVTIPSANFDENGAFEIEVINTDNDNVIHTTKAKTHEPVWISADTLRVIVDNRVEYIKFESENGEYTPETRAYESDFYRSDALPVFDFISPQQDSALIHMNDGSLTGIGVLDFATDEKIPIIQYDNEVYNALAYYPDDDSGNIGIFITDENRFLAHWLVSVELD